jgi:hypothetical protein
MSPAIASAIPPDNETPPGALNHIHRLDAQLAALTTISVLKQVPFRGDAGLCDDAGGSGNRAGRNGRAGLRIPGIESASIVEGS